MSNQGVSYDIESVGEAHEWFEGRDADDVEREISDLDYVSIHTLRYAADDDEVENIIAEEISDRDQNVNARSVDREINFQGYKTAQGVSDGSTDENAGGEVWDSGLAVLDDPKVIVPEEVRRTCVAVQEDVGYNEWGLLFKGEWTDEGFKVKPDYVVPEQNASTAHIQYEEDLKKYRDEGYVVNVHSHPMSGKGAGFSGTDDDHINSHFDMALLYGGKADTIVGATANVEVADGVMLSVDPSVKVKGPKTEKAFEKVNGVRRMMRKLGMHDIASVLKQVKDHEPEMPEVDTENIEIKKRTRNKSSGSSKYGSSSYSRYKHRDYSWRPNGGRNSRGTQKTLEGGKADKDKVEKAVRSDLEEKYGRR